MVNRIYITAFHTITEGQAAVGPKGMQAITGGMEEYRQMREVVEGSMGVLCNLCALPANGESFVMNGCLQLFDSLYSDPESVDNVRLASASVLHNLAANLTRPYCSHLPRALICW